MNTCTVPYQFVDIVDEFVQVLVPLVGIFILKVRAHREHDVVGGVMRGLVDHGLDECAHSLLNIVVKQVWVILATEPCREQLVPNTKIYIHIRTYI